ncbi:MAG: TolC family protein [Flavihumibacter sp.]|nr:TolC family protein [Flavihumibacter sp.]
MKYKFLVTGLLFCCLGSDLAAQKLLTLEEAIATALKNNYDIQLLRNDSASFALDNKYANAAFYPQVNGSVNKVWNNNDQLQRFTDGTKRERDGVKSSNLAASVNLNWTLFDGGGMFVTRKRIAEIEQLGALSVKNQVVNTVAAIVINYYNIVRQQQQLKAIEEQMSINEERVKLADKKLSVGLGSKPELLQAKVDLNAQKAAQLRQQTLIAQLRDQLNQLMAKPVGEYYKVTDSIPLNYGLTYNQVAEGIENTNPLLQITKKNKDIAQLLVKERKADLWPTISFTSAYNYSRLNNKVVVNPFQPLFSLNNGYNYGFNAQIPIFNAFNTRRLIKQAQLDLQYQDIVFMNQQQQINTSLGNAYKDYELQKKTVQLEEDNIVLAKENVSIAFERYKQGVSTYLELREAQRSLEDGYNRLIAARYNLKLAETELLRLKGKLVD